MAFAKTAQLQGDHKTYELSPDLKQYTLLDLNFKKRKAGSFELVQPLNNIQESRVIKAQLKIVIASDLKTFKMDIVDGKGLRKINLFKGTQYQAEQHQLTFVLQNLQLRKVIQPKN